MIQKFCSVTFLDPLSAILQLHSVFKSASARRIFEELRPEIAGFTLEHRGKTVAGKGMLDCYKLNLR